MKAAAATILRTWTDLRNGEITADDARDIMGRLRDELGEADYQHAKLIAATNDR